MAKDKQGAEVATVTVKPSELRELLTAMIPTGENVLVVGPPGCGKSDGVYQAAAAVGAPVIRTDLSNADTTVATGLPWFAPGADHADFKPYGDLYAAVRAERTTVWLLEEIGLATPMVQGACMPLLSPQRKSGALTIPKCISFVATSNRRTDRAGVNGLLEPVKSRFTTIVELQPDLNDWISWFFEAFNGESTEVPAFLRFKPALLSDFNPNADMTNSPSPRTWASVGRILRLGLPQHLEFVALVGAIGAGAAGEFKAFQKVWRELPDLEGILMDPKNAPIPEGPSALYAVCMGLAGKANMQNFSRIATYTERLAKGHHGEFAVLLVQDALRKDKGIKDTKPFVDLITKSEVGKLIRGESGR